MSFDRSNASDILKLNQISGFNIWPSLKRSLTTTDAGVDIDLKRPKRVDIDGDVKNMNLVLAPNLDPAAICQHQ